MNFKKMQGIIQIILEEYDYQKLLTLIIQEYAKTEVMISELETIIFSYFNLIFIKGISDKKIEAEELKILTEKRTIKVNLEKFDVRYSEFILKIKKLKEEVFEEIKKIYNHMNILYVIYRIFLRNFQNST